MSAESDADRMAEREHADYHLERALEATHCPDPNVEAVREDLLQRAAHGLLKYKTDTTREDLSHGAWLRHLLDELEDAAIYVSRIGSNNDKMVTLLTNIKLSVGTNHPAYGDLLALDRLVRGRSSTW